MRNPSEEDHCKKHSNSLQAVFIYEFFGAALYTYDILAYNGEIMMSTANLFAGMMLTYKHNGAHV